MSGYERHDLEPEGNSGGPGKVLFAAVAGTAGYALGKQHGYNEGYTEGYTQAKTEDNEMFRRYDVLGGAYRQRAEALREQLGQLQAEKKMLTELLRQQPSNPQIDAILKAVQRVEFRLTEFLPPQFESGSDGQNPRLN